MTLAKASAAAYRRRGGYDSDAQEDAFLFIVSTDFKIDLLDDRTRSYIVKTTAGALLRRDQNARGARLKNPPSFLPLLSHEELEELGFKGVLEDAIASSKKDDDEIEKERAALAQALEELQGLDRDILDRVLEGRTAAQAIEKELNVGILAVFQTVKKLVRRTLDIKGDIDA